RRAFVRADELTLGERLGALVPRPLPAPVYNIEVHADHVYHIADLGVLVHNAKKQTFAPVAKKTQSTDDIPTVTFSSKTHPELADNIRNAQAAGHPSILTHGG